jgi:adenosylcobinamide-GDP ribazoletransferase
MTRLANALRLAFAFLTVLPFPVREAAFAEADLAASRYAFPVVGLAIGLVLAGLSESMARLAVPPLLASFLLLAASVALTGALHLDGLADTFDGLFLGGGPERRLAAMRDPHVGSFGVAALVLILLGKFSALSGLTGHSRSLAILAAAAISRTSILVSAGVAPYARPEGTGRILVAATTPRDALRAAVAICVLGVIVFPRSGLAIGMMDVGLAWGLSRLALRRLGGITGDVLGALVELGELAILLVWAMVSPSLSK